MYLGGRGNQIMIIITKRARHTERRWEGLMEWDGRTKSSAVGEARPWTWISLERKRTKDDSCDEGSTTGDCCWRHEVERRRPRV